jgi:signal peptidase II
MTTGVKASAGYLRLLLTAAIVVALDQVTKTIAVNALSEGRVFDLIPGAVSFNLGYNSGGAFGLLQGLPGLFLVATSLVIVLILLWVRRIEDPRWLIPVGMVLGGGLGNLADRLFRSADGRVVDFIDFHVWPIFNIADASIVIGVGLILILGMRPRPEKEPDHGEPGGES